jgi:hypothetical protein
MFLFMVTDATSVYLALTPGTEKSITNRQWTIGNIGAGHPQFKYNLYKW